MGRITKRKAPEGSGWQVVADGKPTALRIIKGDPPRYREPQMYDVLRRDGDEYDYLFEASSVHNCMAVLASLVAELT